MGTDGDTFVLALPVAAGSQLFALIAFLGGLSASTAMVIVECIALSIMVCNNLVVPLLLRRKMERSAVHQDMSETLILIRRMAIICVLGLAYAYFQMIGSTAALAQVGLLSFAAVAQFAPAFFGGLVWKRATARGAMWGITAGFAVWVYTLLMPSFADAGWIGRSFLDEGPFGIGLFKARMLFAMEFNPLTHGVIWSLLANVTAYVAGSLMRPPTPIERVQATSFVAREIQPGSGTGFKLWRTAVTADRLEDTVARYIGIDRARAAFEGFRAQQGQIGGRGGEADVRLIRFAEHLLASAVGVASARLVIALMLERHSTHARGAMKLLDDASAAIQHNRDLLQSAIDNVDQGLAVFEPGMTLICWNSTLQDFLGLGSDLNRVGTPITEVLGAFLSRTASGKEAVDDRVSRIAVTQEVFRERRMDTGQVFEFRSSPMPDGGVVVTVIDATESVLAAEELQRVNESLERRVMERTAELTRLNAELADAKAEADAANLSKTRFIAAASHDILQPLNAARLFTSTPRRAHEAVEGWRACAKRRLLARSGGGNPLGAARHFAARRGRHEGRGGALPHRRHPAGAVARIRAGGAQEGPEVHCGGLQPHAQLRPQAAPPRAAELRLQRHQVHEGGPRADGLQAARHHAAHRGSRYGVWYP